jgi:hypothetical protein
MMGSGHSAAELAILNIFEKDGNTYPAAPAPTIRTFLRPSFLDEFRGFCDMVVVLTLSRSMSGCARDLSIKEDGRRRGEAPVVPDHSAHTQRQDNDASSICVQLLDRIEVCGRLCFS